MPLGLLIGRSRVLDGGSTGGWVSLALQVFYPDFFNGCWSSCPDPVDFRDYDGRTVRILDNHVLRAEDYDAWAQQPGPAMVVFADDPERYREMGHEFPKEPKG